MRLHRRSRRAAAIALAGLGLAAPAAQARLIDPPLPHHPASASQPYQKRDLRSADAGEAARLAAREQERQVVASRGQGAPRPVVATAPVAPVKTAGDGLDVASIAVGAAGFLAFAAAIVAANAALMRRRRVHAVR